MEKSDLIKIEIIREACAKEFIRAYEEAGIKGLCEDGRIEYAVDAVRSLNLKKIIDEMNSPKEN